MKTCWKRSTLQHSQNSKKLPMIGLHVCKHNKEKLSNILHFNYETISELKCNVYVLCSQNCFNWYNAAVLSTCFWDLRNIATKLALVSLHAELQFETWAACKARLNLCSDLILSELCTYLPPLISRNFYFPLRKLED